MACGSTWQKWDLHVHTPCSFEHSFKLDKSVAINQYQNAIWEKYIESLEKIQDIAVIGITDYFSIEGYKKVLEYRSNGRLQNIATILPNIEFRLDKFVDGKKLNYHVIFSDKVPVDKIEKEFLESLTIKTKNGNDRRLTRENVLEIGRDVKNHQPELKKESDYKVGCINTTISLDQIVDTLKSRGSLFEGKYLLVLVDEDWNKIRWQGQGHIIKSILLEHAHAIFSADEGTRKFALGEKDNSPEKFMAEFGNPKPCIYGSDTHSFENFCIPSNDKFCWIKGEPTFDGLKQTIFEPKERVCIQSENPELQKNMFSLKSIEIQNSTISDELSFPPQKIYLNSNLVAITGGKGSGKTALLDFIANCYENRCKSGGADKNSFIQRIEDQKKDLAISLEFIGNDVERFSKTIVDMKFIENSRITYLPQGKIEEISGNRKKLDNKTFEIIFSNDLVSKRNVKEKFEDLKNKIDTLCQNIELNYQEIVVLEKASSNEIYKNLDASRKLKLGELANKENDLALLLKEIAQGIGEKINALKENEKNSRQLLKKYHILQNSIVSLQETLETQSKELNTNIDRINDMISTLKLEAEPIPPIEFTPQNETLEKIILIFPEILRKLNGEILELRSQLGQLSGSEKKQADILKEIDSKKTEIASIDDNLKEFECKRAKIKELEKTRISNYLAMLKYYHEWRMFYDEVISLFSQGKSEILSDVSFESTIHINMDDLLEDGIDLFNKRKISADEIQRMTFSFPEVILEVNEEKREQLLKDVLTALLSKENCLKPKRSKNEIFKWLMNGEYLSLSTQIKCWNTPLEKLSMGQKGTVLLKLFLAEGDYPIILVNLKKI